MFWGRGGVEVLDGRGKVLFDELSLGVGEVYLLKWWL